ncbi:MAG: PQQ-dependent sugar dehydrogenase [Caldilinea sp.]
MPERLRCVLSWRSRLQSSGLFSDSRQWLATGVLTVLATATLLGASRAGEAQATDAVVLQEVAAGFNQPVYLTHAGDGSGRLFVVEKAGRVKIIEAGSVREEPFLDITDRVSNNGEAGLLSIAFPPEYADTGYFLVYYNHRDKNLVQPEAGDQGINDGFDTVVARFRVTADPNLADPDSEERILLRNQPYTNHNGGLIVFGPDGALYIGLGDGGSSGDPLGAGQDLSTWLGKILRIQVGPTGTYHLPPDNPFVGQEDAQPEIWDWGLRNPWRFSFDRQSGDLWIGDVGQNQQEEIHLHPAGEPGGLNFGWNCYEGELPYRLTERCTASYQPPVLVYPREEGRSVTGGYVYRGSRFPSLSGRYFFADYVQGRLWSIQRSGDSGWTPKRLELDSTEGIVSLGEDEAGELYLLGFGSGTVYQIVDADPPSPPPTPVHASYLPLVRR